MKKIKLIIAEDHPLMRKGYLSAFEDYDHISVIGEAENGKILLELLARKKPDIVLLDIEMPEMDGLQAL